MKIKIKQGDKMKILDAEIYTGLKDCHDKEIFTGNWLKAHYQPDCIHCKYLNKECDSSKDCFQVWEGVVKMADGKFYIDCDQKPTLANYMIYQLEVING
jgi:hypothetical protein